MKDLKKKFQEQLDALAADLNKYTSKRDVLSNLDLFVLDNSLRESTVGQLRGHTTSDKWEIFEEELEKSAHVIHLLAEIKEKWDEWDERDGKKDDEIDFLAFYNGFMGKYFGCYTCYDTKRALGALDMDKDGRVDWKEFALYLNWAAEEYPETESADELISIAFHKGLIPDMQDYILREEAEKGTAESLINSFITMPLIHDDTSREENTTNTGDDTATTDGVSREEKIKLNTINTEDDIPDDILTEESINDNTTDIETVNIGVGATTAIKGGIVREENIIVNSWVNAAVAMPKL